MKQPFLPKRVGLTQADGSVTVPLGLNTGARLHQVQVVSTDTSGTFRFKLRTPGAPEPFTPVDDTETEVVIDLSKVNRVAQLYGFSDIVEVTPSDVVGEYGIYICSGGE